MTNPSKDFWTDRNVFITGHTGFKGGWLCCWLKRLGARVTGYSLDPPSDPSLYALLKNTGVTNSIHGDVRDSDHLLREMRSSSPSVVLHMAAQALVRPSYAEPIDTYATNVMGTVNVLDAARHCSGVDCVVVVTTDKCYENDDTPRAFVETDRLGGLDPYSNSKACAELVTCAFRNSYFPVAQYETHRTAIASARAGNVIGGGDWATDRLIADVMRAVVDKEIVTIRNPNAVRPWQHVLEPLCGYLILAEKLCECGADYSSGWNFGPDVEDAKPVSWIIEALCEAWPDAVRWKVEGQQSRLHEALTLSLDISKSKTLLGYEPRVGLQRTVQWVADWYRGYMQGADVDALTAGQIEEFEDLHT